MTSTPTPRSASPPAGAQMKGMARGGVALARASLILAQLRGDNEEQPSGFDAQTGTYKDLVAAGAIDPTKVARVESQNAASVARFLITTKAWSPSVRRSGSMPCRLTAV